MIALIELWDLNEIWKVYLRDFGFIWNIEDRYEIFRNWSKPI